MEEIFGENSTEFFNTLKEKLEVDGMLKNELEILMENKSGGWQTKSIMLHKYLHEAELSIQRGSTGNRFQGPLMNLKKFAAYFFLKGGAYNTLYNNSLLPSVSTIKLDIVNNQKLEIGKVYVKEFKKFMSERGITENVVVISEDGTGIIKKVCYDPETNQLVGLLPDFDATVGLPITKNFEASTPSKVIEFLKKYKVATYLEVVMGKPFKIGNYLY
jgi:hypothetical protein